MKTFFSTTARVEGGQLDAALAGAADAAKVVGRHGGDVRFFLAIVAGEQVESTLFSVEYDSPDAMGKAFDAMNTDPELHRIRTQATGSTQTSASMGMELPTSHTPTPGRGSIIELHVSNVKPGRMAEFLGDCAEVCAFVEANGAMNAVGPAADVRGDVERVDEFDLGTREHGRARPFGRGMVHGQRSRTASEGTGRCGRTRCHGCEPALQRDPALAT